MDSEAEALQQQTSESMSTPVVSSPTIHAPVTLNELSELSGEVVGAISPRTHLLKLLRILEFNDMTQPASELFFYMLNDQDAFFGKINDHWSTRTISAAMESLKAILNKETVKTSLISEIGVEQYNKIVSFVDTKRKSYMNDTKKQARNMMKHKQPTIIESAKNSSNSVHVETVTNHETLSIGNEGVIKIMDTINSDTFDVHVLHEHVHKAAVILGKYIDGEKDDIKRIVLDLIHKELQAVLTIIS